MSGIGESQQYQYYSLFRVSKNTTSVHETGGKVVLFGASRPYLSNDYVITAGC